MDADLVRWIKMPWRTGRTLGRTIYAQVGAEPSKDDVFLGIMDTRALALHTVQIHNERRLHGGQD